MTDSTTLQIRGLNELEVAEIKQELRAQGINLDEISEVQRAAIGNTKVGDPGTLDLLLRTLGPMTPVIAGALAAWLLKGRKGKRKRRFTFILSKGTMQLGYRSSDEFLEEGTDATIQDKVLAFMTK